MYLALASASGAPGVSTSALALALMSPNPSLLVEADVAGASSYLAGWFGGNPPHNYGIVNLAMAHRSGTMAQAISDIAIEIPNTNVQLISGIRSHTQVSTIAPLWDSLAHTLQSVNRSQIDVIVDVGRLSSVGAALPLVYAADLALLTLRTSLPDVSRARSWAATLQETFTAQGKSASAGLLVIGESKAYSAHEVSQVLGIPAVASLAWDPGSAQVFSQGKPSRRVDSGALGRSLKSAMSTITHAARLAQDHFDPSAQGASHAAGNSAGSSTSAVAGFGVDQGVGVNQGIGPDAGQGEGKDSRPGGGA